MLLFEQIESLKPGFAHAIARGEGVETEIGVGGGEGEEVAEVGGEKENEDEEREENGEEAPFVVEEMEETPPYCG